MDEHEVLVSGEQIGIGDADRIGADRDLGASGAAPEAPICREVPTTPTVSWAARVRRGIGSGPAGRLREASAGGDGAEDLARRTVSARAQNAAGMDGLTTYRHPRSSRTLADGFDLRDRRIQGMKVTGAVGSSPLAW